MSMAQKENSRYETNVQTANASVYGRTTPYESRNLPVSRKLQSTISPGLIAQSQAKSSAKKRRKKSKSRSRSPNKSNRKTQKSRSPRSRKRRGKSSTKKRRTATEIAEHLKPNGDTKSRSRLAYQRSKNRTTSRGYGGSSQYYQSFKRESINPLRPPGVNERPVEMSKTQEIASSHHGSIQVEELNQTHGSINRPPLEQNVAGQ
jgi:hypothetical protein